MPSRRWRISSTFGGVRPLDTLFLAGAWVASVPAVSVAAGLTAREVEGLRLVARDLTNREVAAHLAGSPRTTAARFALDNGLA